VLLPDASAYARPELNRLLFGFREKESVSLNPRALPEKMTGYIFTEDPDGWKSMIEDVPDFGIFMPIIEELEIPHYIKGLSNYTPDGNFILGPYPDLDGFLAATGCTGAGIAMCGGIGRLVAELATGHAQFIDPSPHRINRFGKIESCNRTFIQRCADARSGKITG
jgi:sarcosine oxidase, subunit beta